jgi:hypothetical protein
LIDYHLLTGGPYIPECILVVPQAERAATSPASVPLHIYQAYYSGSAEKAAFTFTVDRESRVFGDLIRAKQHLVLPADMGQPGLQQVAEPVA